MSKLKCLLVIFFLGISSIGARASDDVSSATTNSIENQQANCAKNTAMEWNAPLNRCVGKQAARDTRQAAQACAALTDLTAREQCNLALAEKNSGLSSDTSTLNQGNTSKSMMMNGVTTAYWMINYISNLGKDGEKSQCTSKMILGVTSIAGLASDIFLKMKAKKKVKELEGKYKLEASTGTKEAQIKALEYLREEQQTVVEIASMEKKRNMMLMLGYGIASAWAVYEMTSFGAANADCVKPSTADKTNINGVAKGSPP